MTKLSRALARLPVRVATVLRFITFYNIFRNQRRVIYTKNSTEREPLGEHTDQLTLFAWFMMDCFKAQLSHLDPLKVQRYALVHDLVEVYADDTCAFPDKLGTFNLKLDRSTKEERERLALERLEYEWKRTFPSMLQYIHAYERRDDEESKFVYALDKFVADLNIFEDGGRTNILLGVTYEEKVAYKRPRIAEHPFVLGLFDEFSAYCKAHPELYYQPALQQTAAE